MFGIATASLALNVGHWAFTPVINEGFHAIANASRVGRVWRDVLAVNCQNLGYIDFIGRARTVWSGRDFREVSF